MDSKMHRLVLWSYKMLVMIVEEFDMYYYYYVVCTAIWMMIVWFHFAPGILVSWFQLLHCEEQKIRAKMRGVAALSPVKNRFKQMHPIKRSWGKLDIYILDLSGGTIYVIIVWYTEELVYLTTVNYCDQVLWPLRHQTNKGTTTMGKQHLLQRRKLIQLWPSVGLHPLHQFLDRWWFFHC